MTMVKQFVLILLIVVHSANIFGQKETDTYTIETKNTVIVVSSSTNGKLLFQYFGAKSNDISAILKSGIGANTEIYPTFGIECTEEKALQATHTDGNLSTDLYLQSVSSEKLDENLTVTKIVLADNKYSFFVTVFLKAFYNEDVVETWTEITNSEAGRVTLFKFASVSFPVRSYNPWITHFHGNWADEFNMVEEKLEAGVKTIKNREGIRNTQRDNPSIMISLDGRPNEDYGDVIAGTLVWTGNYKITLDVNKRNNLNFIAGINEDASQIILESGESFKTPSFIYTFSNQGKGQATRNIHRWARNYGIIDGDKERDILLNSWEGVYFDTKEEKMLKMIDDISSLGGELFVMDDGWFGDKYPRNNETTSLGDWKVNKTKLPNGLSPLIQHATSKGIKFGIWLEPEMVNVKSELFEKHPDWVIHQPNRETILGRGGSQMTLDLTNPDVQEYVFQVIHQLLIQNPGIAYIKWDANHFISNVGTQSLPADKQSHLYIDYQRGLNKILEKIRTEHPQLLMQACASGGGRVTYGYLKYFYEFWTSDNTDALSRLYMQWGASHFFPAINMASHVSASPNHQTHREIPLKVRFDVAMTGRLGIEMQPADLSANELEFARNAISIYKNIRPVIQFGDLYRLISPYENNQLASLMYVTENQQRAVLFAFNLKENLTYRFPPLKLKGLNPEKKYLISEINTERQLSRLPFNNQVFSGDYLMKSGIQINMRSVLQSVVIELKTIE
jgi:alpha-galactosidase